MNKEKITAELLDYVRSINPVAKSMDNIPLDKSLYELGILDSFEIVELVFFIEKNWAIKIYDAELTKENFGGVNKMVNVISGKMVTKAAG